MSVVRIYIDLSIDSSIALEIVALEVLV